MREKPTTQPLREERGLQRPRGVSTGFCLQFIFLSGGSRNYIFGQMLQRAGLQRGVLGAQQRERTGRVLGNKQIIKKGILT